MDLRYGTEERHREDSSNGKPVSAMSGNPDIPCFLLLNDPANELLLPAGLGTNRILMLDTALTGRWTKVRLRWRLPKYLA
jgi:hypothetical protein